VSESIIQVERSFTDTLSADKWSLTDNQVLSARDLNVQFTHEGRTIDAVRNLSFHVNRGETLAIVGESGSGKSVTSLALMRLIEQGGGKINQGDVLFRRRNAQIVDLTAASHGIKIEQAERTGACRRQILRRRTAQSAKTDYQRMAGFEFFLPVEIKITQDDLAIVTQGFGIA